MNAFGPVRNTICRKKDISPAEDFFPVPLQMEMGIFTAANEELINSLLLREFFERLLRVCDRQRYYDGPGPRGDLIDIEVPPLRKQNELRRNRGNGVVLILAHETEINLGEGVDLSHATVGENPLSRLHQHRVVCRPTHQLQCQIGFDSKRDIRRAIRMDAPATVFILMTENLVDCAFHPATIP